MGPDGKVAGELHADDEVQHLDARPPREVESDVVASLPPRVGADRPHELKRTRQRENGLVPAVRVIVHPGREAAEVTERLDEVGDWKTDGAEGVHEVVVLQVPPAHDAAVRLVRSPVATPRHPVRVEKTGARGDPPGVEHPVARVRDVVRVDGKSGAESSVLQQTVLGSLRDSVRVGVPRQRQSGSVPERAGEPSQKDGAAAGRKCERNDGRREDAERDDRPNDDDGDDDDRRRSGRDDDRNDRRTNSDDRRVGRSGRRENERERVGRGGGRGPTKRAGARASPAPDGRGP